MISGYIGRKIKEQIRAVSFIVVYLIVFQLAILRSPETLQLSHLLGILLVVIGLTFFLEGLYLGLMPLGESVGLKLPRRTRLYQIMLFALVVGFVSTLAEPAVATLKSAGSRVLPWEQPLLYTLLQTRTSALIAAVGAGVALAVALSMFRFYYGISLKPFIMTILPLVLAGTLYFSMDENLSSVIGLAWDTGAVTTGPVTVPLVLAMGIGVSRASGDRKGPSGGFGSIALASLLPVLGVMVLAIGVSTAIPEPMDREAFFSQDFQTEATSFLGGEDRYEDLKRMQGNQPLQEQSVDDTSLDTLSIIEDQSASALKAIIPLTFILGGALFFFLKERLRYMDEFFFGITLTIIGMILLTSGIFLGLVPLGDTVGQQLPKVYTAEEHERVIILDDFDMSLVHTAVDSEGETHQYFFLVTPAGKVEQQPFIHQQYDNSTGQYTHIQRTPVLFEKRLTTLSMLFVLVFAFGLGYGSTLAEPALNALGRNVEEITVGTVPRTGVVRAVSIGVGTGLTFGVLRIIYSIPLTWILVPVYLLLIPLTLLSDKEFAGIAWDSGGVTTGPITVPLVLSLGLGIGGALGAADGFGILAFASVFPILSVQCYGFLIAAKQKRTIRALEQEADNE
jgi:hypothetical protein